MAFVRNAANAVFWVVMVQAVIGLGKFEAPKGEAQ